MSTNKGFNRRDFLKVIGAGTGLAATGCAKDVPEKLIPYVIQPEEVIPGNSVWYTGTCNECSAGCGVLVRTKEGRALKVEGNPNHPVNKGGLCALGQSSVQALYDPDRVREPQKRASSEAFKPVKWSEAIDAVAEEISKADAEQKKTIIVSKPLSGSENKILNQFASKFKGIEIYEYELLSSQSLNAASSAVFGKGTKVDFALDQADVILGVGADYLETWISPVKYSKQFSNRRVPERLGKIKNASKALSKVYHVEPRLSLTAANADVWYKNSPNSESLVLKAVLSELMGKKSLSSSQKSAADLYLKGFSKSDLSKSGLSNDQVSKLVADLLKADNSLVLAGGASTSKYSTSIIALALLINDILGNVGQTVLVSKNDSQNKVLTPELLGSLVNELNSGNVANVVFIDVNPLYSLPVSSGFLKALSKAKFTAAFSKSFDETTNTVNVVLPLSTSFESWSDSEPMDGVFALNQPAMQPLYKTQGLGDIILSLDTSPKNTAGGQFKGITDFSVYIQNEWKKRIGESKFKASWDEIVSQGGELSNSKNNSIVNSGSYDLSVVKKLSTDIEKLTADVSKLTFIAFPTVHFHDGRGANRSWMQEIPDPMTTTVWGSWIEMHPDTAEAHGFKHTDVVQVKTQNGSVEAPVFLTKHIHPSLVAAPIGLGHTEYGRYAAGIGSNSTSVLDFDSKGDQLSLVTEDVKLLPSVAADTLVAMQFSDTELQRGFVRGITVETLVDKLNNKSHEESHHEGGHHDPLALGPREEPKQMYKQMEHPLYKWGMSIDLSACTGCSACVAACYAENNVPVVGKQVCNQGREMSWLKIARYFDGPEEHPVTGFGPSLCQHCGNAPCEPVCPVYGTYHSEDGLNTMVYNRCVGTRYCSNNCSYKVRRFNWFNYEWPEPLNWQLNPDVTVRGVGIMEKCTFCIQRIREGQNVAKDEGRLIADGDIKPACASSCPTDAIKFGNLLDKNSLVAKDAESPRGYKILDVELNTQPAITYLAKVNHVELNPKKHVTSENDGHGRVVEGHQDKNNQNHSEGH